MLPTILPIILAIRDEDDQNFVAEVYTKHTKNLQFIASSYLQNKLDIDDCIQEVVIVLIDRVEDFRQWDETRQFCFLMKCCRFIAINKYNYNQSRYEKEISYNLPDGKDLEFVDEDSYIERIIISKDNQKRFAQMIEDMDPIHGDILYFKCFLRMKNVEIAKMINVSEQVVSSRLKQARRILLTTRKEEFDAIFRK